MLLSRALLKRHSVLPGFDLALGFTLLYLSFIVLVPLSAAFLKTFTMTWPAFWDAVTAPRVVASSMRSSTCRSRCRPRSPGSP